MDTFSTLSGTLMRNVLMSLSVHMSTWSTFDRLSDSIGSSFGSILGEQERFDFIVVGGGTAGGVVAHRLSQHYSVLLLEAGGEMNDWQQIPGMSFLLLGYPEIDWNHKTTSQKDCCWALPRNRSHWSQGRNLGGTANLNFLIQSRGSPRDFDNWAEILGDPNWSYNALLPYFKRTENYEGQWERNGYHGKGGEITVGIPPFTGMANTFVDAAVEYGYPQQDLNANFTEGFDVCYYPMWKGRRWVVYNAMINSIRSRPTLTIRKYAMVNRILIDGFNRAYGVEYERHGSVRKAFANKEIVVTAGAVPTPAILLRSGIGPREHLQEMGIPVKVDLAGVGQNLQDHMSTYLGPFFVDAPITISLEEANSAENIAEYFASQTGPITTTGTQAMGFYSTKYAKERGEGDWPDVQTILIGASIYENYAADVSRGFNIKYSVAQRYYKHAVGKESFTQIVSNARPLARGYVKLSSKDPNVQPVIEPNYFQDQKDVDVLVEGIKIAVDIVENTTTFRKIGGRFTDQVFPGCEGVPFRSDAYWECYARHYSITLHYIVGSCKLGTLEDPYAVVDTQLKVYGVERLRILDASVMPVVPVGNTMAPIIMIAEKGSDMILREWRNRKYF